MAKKKKKRSKGNKYFRSFRGKCVDCDKSQKFREDLDNPKPKTVYCAKNDRVEPAMEPVWCNHYKRRAA